MSKCVILLRIRSSSIASNGPSRQKSKSKSKSKSSGSSGGRGYNPSAVNYKESEYHYGSDFEDEYDDDDGAAHGDDDESGKSDSSSDLDDSRDAQKKAWAKMKLAQRARATGGGAPGKVGTSCHR